MQSFTPLSELIGLPEIRTVDAVLNDPCIRSDVTTIEGFTFKSRIKHGSGMDVSSTSSLTNPSLMAALSDGFQLVVILSLSRA